MPCRRINLIAFIFVLGAPSADAAAPAIIASETSVRLGLTAGYSSYQAIGSPGDHQAGALLGGELSAGVLSASPLDGIGSPDLYGNIDYQFSAGYLRYDDDPRNPDQTTYHGRDNSFYNTVIVRLGLGQPLGTGGELIPYLAGGYQNRYRNLGGNTGSTEYDQAGLVGGGMKFDLAASSILVMSASAEGLAVVGGNISVPSQDFNGGFGTSAEERVRLDADYRFTASWHAFAGIGLTHYNYIGSKPDDFGRYGPSSQTLQINSLFGIAYGF